MTLDRSYLYLNRNHNLLPHYFYRGIFSTYLALIKFYYKTGSSQLKSRLKLMIWSNKMVDCGFISTFHSKFLNTTQQLLSKNRLYNIGFEPKKSELSNSKKQNGQDLCSIPRSCYDRRVSFYFCHQWELLSPRSVTKFIFYFSINLHAQVAVVTKAKLDAVSVKGDCKCD